MMDSKWKYVEVANYVPSIERVIRWQFTGDDGEKHPVFLEYGDEVEHFRRKHNNTGVYTSIFRFEEKDIDATRVGNLFFDLDAEDNVKQSKDETRKLYEYLCEIVDEAAIAIYFTGSKGFHIEVSHQALGITPGYELHRIFRFISEEIIEELALTTIDSAVYDARRMWRLEDSIHQKTGLYKARLPYQALKSSVENIQKFASLPPNDRPNFPTLHTDLDIHGNRRYKEWVIGYENLATRESERRAQKRAELFAKFGTTLLKGYNKGFIATAWEQAVEDMGHTDMRNVTLNKHAFKIYVLYLRSNLPIEEVTSKMYDIADSVGLEEREITATLKSAERAALDKYQEYDDGR